MKFRIMQSETPLGYAFFSVSKWDGERWAYQAGYMSEEDARKYIASAANPKPERLVEEIEV